MSSPKKPKSGSVNYARIAEDARLVATANQTPQTAYTALLAQLVAEIASGLAKERQP